MNFQFKFRSLQESDLPVMADWLNRKHLQEWWGSGKITPESVREKYLPRIAGKADAIPFLAFLEDQPFGYIQYYWAALGDPNWWPDQPGSKTIGIDQFIADENHLNKGMGTIMIRQFIQFLINRIDITEIRTDPKPENLRSIRCYQKLGFTPIGEIITPDGPAIMMVLKLDRMKPKV